MYDNEIKEAFRNLVVLEASFKENSLNLSEKDKHILLAARQVLGEIIVEQRRK